ncbi:MAG: hypothetical protein GY794_27000 [bacterium]|nr:hypothetical protein [bacterium]
MRIKDTRILSITLSLCLLVGVSPGKSFPTHPPPEPAKAIAAARDKGLAWLTKSQGRLSIFNRKPPKLPE